MAPTTRSSSAAATTGSPPTAYLARAGLRVVCLERRDDPRRRLRHRGALARRPRLARLLRRLDAAAEDRLRPAARRLRLPGDPARPRLRLAHRAGADLLLQRGRAHRRLDRQAVAQGRRGLSEVRGAVLARRALRQADDAARAAGARLEGTRPTSRRCCARRAALAGFSKREIHELVRVFTMSVGDLLDDYFELDGLKGSTASSGVVGVWAGPRTPGTAYNLLHHALGECDGIEGAWGQVIGGMGAISQGDRALRRKRRRRDPHRGRGRLDRRPQRRRDRRHARRRQRASRPDRRLRRASEDDRARAHRRRALPGRDRRGDGALPHPRRLGQGQPAALRAARATRA